MKEEKTQIPCIKVTGSKENPLRAPFYTAARLREPINRQAFCFCLSFFIPFDSCPETRQRQQGPLTHTRFRSIRNFVTSRGVMEMEMKKKQLKHETFYMVQNTLYTEKRAMNFESMNEFGKILCSADSRREKNTQKKHSDTHCQSFGAVTQNPRSLIKRNVSSRSRAAPCSSSFVFGRAA